MVLQVGARALTKHALNVHCGHDDFNAALDTGWIMLMSKDAQQAADQGIILRKVCELALNPGMNIQDGMLTTHSERMYLAPEAELLREYLGAAEDMIDCPTPAQKELFGSKRRRVPIMMDLKNPVLLGPVQNQEHHMNGVIARRDEDAANAEWQRHWDVNVMAHVYAARAVLPQMLARGAGYLLHTVSAAGLLSQVNAAPYSVTKHAALGFAEWLSIAHGAQGIRVSALCPQGVVTPMLLGADAASGRPSFLADGALSAEQVAACTVQGLRDERFLILPHSEVLGYFQRKASDYERWLGGMRRLRAKVTGDAS